MSQNGAPELQLGCLYITMLLFADDLCILDSSARGLQRKIDILLRYCVMWGFSLNVEKTKVVRFRKSVRSKFDYTWFANGYPIGVVDEYKYLGLYVHCTGKWNSAKSDVCRRANRAIFMLVGNLNRFGNVPPSMIMKIFDSKIVPILTYGSELWGLANVEDLEKIASNFYRRVLGLHSSASVILSRGELGRKTMFHTFACRVIKYWSKILNSRTDRAIYKCYQYQLELSHNNRPCWATSVKQLLFNFGFGDIWMAQNAGNWNVFWKIFKMRSADIEAQNWHGCVENFGNLRTYKTCKFELKCEWFLCIELPKNVINRLVRLRGGLLRIGVNEGRWRKIPYDERVCKLCSSKSVDDEVHFLFHCRALSTFRVPLLRFPAFRHRNFRSIFECENRTLIQHSITFREEVQNTF